MRSLSLVCLLVVLGSAMLAAQSSTAALLRLGRPGGQGSKSVRTTSVHQPRNLNLDPPNAQVGFLAATQIPAGPPPFGAGTYSPYPGVVGDFNGDGNPDVAALVNNNTLSTPIYAISAVLGNGDGTFQPAVLTTVTLSSGTDIFDPIFVGDVNGDGKDDIVILHQAAPATVEVWLSNGDGTFTETSQGTITVTSNFGLWATLTAYKPDTALDIVVADNANAGNIWVLKNNGSGTFGAPTAVPFTGQLNTSSTLNTAGVVFADFNGDGYLDFAGPAGPGSTASLNQMVVYLNNGTGGFNGPTALSTPDNVYSACFNVAGDLSNSAHASVNDIVSANCLDNNTVTVYVNDGTGTFSAGVYSQGGIDTTAVAIADMNGDKINDIVSSNQQGADVTVLLGNGDGTMQPATVGYAMGGTRLTASGVVLTPALVADFNKDGHNDAIVPDGLYSFVYLPGFGDGTFRSAVDYYSDPTTAGNGYQTSVGIASGDFNGDGHPDFVVGNSYAFGQKAGNIAVFLSDGKPSGTLQAGVNYGSPTSTNFQFQFVAVGDFNGDGKLDIAATDAINGGVQIFYGKGDGTFTATAASEYRTDAGTYTSWGIIAGDFNGDGKIDLAVVNNTNGGANGDVGVLINNGAGFNPVVNYQTTAPATEITTADVNLDKHLDLIVPLYGTSSTAGTSVEILLGKGDGTFPTNKSTTVGNNPYAAAIGDLNGDGKPDLAVTIQDQTSGHNQGIAVALGNGDGTFQTPTLLQTTMQSHLFGLPQPGYVKMADLNQDGYLDLIYTNSTFSTVGLMYGNGKGGFYDPIESPAGSFASDIAFADVNGDGIPDVVTTGTKKGFSGVTVLLNGSGTDVSVTSSANPSIVGTAVSYKATVVASVRGVTTTPTGSVKFYDGSTLLGSGTLAGGEAVLTTSSTAVGSQSITAQYSGDGGLNFVPSTSQQVLTQVVHQATDSTGLKSSAPSAPLGTTVTFTATVTNTVSGDALVPTGMVTFKDGTTTLGTANLTAGVGTFGTKTLTAGSHSITAVYGGDANFPGSTSAALNQAITTQPAYTLAANPTTQTVNPGSSASYAITLTPVNGYNGTVTFACPSSLPSGVTCTPPSPMAPPYTAGTLKINTTGPSAALVAPANGTSSKGATSLWASLSGIGVFGLVLAGDWKKRNRRRMAIMLGVLAVVMIMALVGCGGGSASGSGGGGGGGGTPAGTDTIKITATDGGSTTPQTLTVTLVVQ